MVLSVYIIAEYLRQECAAKNASEQKNDGRKKAGKKEYHQSHRKSEEYGECKKAACQEDRLQRLCRCGQAQAFSEKEKAEAEADNSDTDANEDLFAVLSGSEETE